MTCADVRVLSTWGGKDAEIFITAIPGGKLVILKGKQFFCHFMGKQVLIILGGKKIESKNICYIGTRKHYAMQFQVGI